MIHPRQGNREKPVAKLVAAVCALSCPGARRTRKAAIIMIKSNELRPRKARLGRQLKIVLLMTLFAFTLRAGDWPTFGHDPQRSGWAFEENRLSPQNAKDLELEWAVQVDNEPLALNALTAPVVASAVATAQGKRTL